MQLPPKFGKTAVGNSGKGNGKFGQKQWEIRAKATGYLGKSYCPKNSKKQQWEIRAKAMGNSGKSIGITPLLVARKIRANSSGKFGQKQWKIRTKSMGYSGKSIGITPLLVARKIRANSSGKFGQKQWKIRTKSMINSGKSFARISHCFSPNFTLLLPEFPIAFARISHSFLPEFFVCQNFWGAQCPPCPPVPYDYT